MLSKMFLNLSRAGSNLSLLNKTKAMKCSRFSSSVTPNNTPGKVVFISQSSDIFTNLALEDWIYQNMTFTKRQVLLLWSNDPCVVIGRHQNPYVESNLTYLQDAKLPIARRKSGGGTVYHDRGNLNCTFFSSREWYDRKWNLNVITKSLEDDFNINSEINCNDNILIDGTYKVSGTAAKLGRLSAYHHCTLLVDSDKQQMKLALQGDKTMRSNATASIPASVKNLRELYPDLSVERLLSSVGKYYLQASLGEQCSSEAVKNADGYTLINPTNDWFPGLDKIKEELLSWTWQHGMTPKFFISRPILLPLSYDYDKPINISIETYHGLIKRISIESDDVPLNLRLLMECDIGEGLNGARYTPDVFQEIINRLRLPRNLMSQSSAS